ncbi:MAG: ABC transporter permease, partial [Clostridia bacterium]|nr:ABC transporter permease [Clostridia bacterium]
MRAVFKREFKAYFNTPLGFIVLAAYYLFLGIYFSLMYRYGSPQMPSLVLAMAIVVTFTVPIITMRLMSDDRRQKTDQVLLTSPVKLTSIVLGKFFAALSIYALGFAPAVIFEIIVLSYVSVNVFSFIYALFGMILLGAALISIGML